MKKYNLSSIMKRAWELIKEFALTRSEGMKKAWAEAKNICNLRGSEKQIAWATEIRNTVIKTAQEAYTAIVTDAEYDSSNPAHVHMVDIYKGWISKAEAETSASFFIDTFKDVVSSDSFFKRLKAIRIGLMLCTYSTKWAYK